MNTMNKIPALWSVTASPAFETCHINRMLANGMNARMGVKFMFVPWSICFAVS